MDKKKATKDCNNLAMLFIGFFKERNIYGPSDSAFTVLGAYNILLKGMVDIDPEDGVMLLEEQIDAFKTNLIKMELHLAKLNGKNG